MKTCNATVRDGDVDLGCYKSHGHRRRSPRPSLPHWLPSFAVRSLPCRPTHLGSSSLEMRDRGRSPSLHANHQPRAHTPTILPQSLRTARFSRHTIFPCLGLGLFLMRSSIPLCNLLHSRGATEPGTSTSTLSRHTGDLCFFLRKDRRHPITLRALTPSLVIEGRVLYLLALARIVLTRKLASQTLLSQLRLMVMRAPAPAHLLATKAGHFNHNLTNHNLTHVAPCRIPSIPSHPVAILCGAFPGSKAFTKVKLLRG